MTSEIAKKSFVLQERRGVLIDAIDALKNTKFCPAQNEISAFDKFSVAYRTLCGVLFNFVPTSGHPGGSISSGHIVSSLLFDVMKYNFSNPLAQENDLVSYAAGHKAMGLYAMWALRNEIVKVGAPDLLPEDANLQLRFEDLLGFRRNPTTSLPLFLKYKSHALDGHPTPATPFLKLSTGASGVGIGSSFGLAYGAADMYGEKAPWVHVIEGEGGLTPGRGHEALAAASTAELEKLILHVDFNQASIDSNRVCRDGKNAGDYVQWRPDELMFLHDWNVIRVNDGFDYKEVMCAQRLAVSGLGNHQPTAIVYSTVKGWKYGIEGRASHGAGHKFCSPEFYNMLGEFEKTFGVNFPKYEGTQADAEASEKAFFDVLTVIREALAKDTELVKFFAEKMRSSQKKLAAEKREHRKNAPNLENVYTFTPETIPDSLKLEANSSVTLRGVLGSVLDHLNEKSGGAIFGSAADLLGSTSLNVAGKHFPSGFYNSQSNPNARILSIGGICEDAIGCIMSGIASFGSHIGVGSSYGAFIAALNHIPARLHAIGQQAKKTVDKNAKAVPFFVVCAHTGVKTGEDGPTHACPQPLQVMSGNFPKGACITLTPWEPQEIWPLVIAALNQYPSVIVPFVTRPAEVVPDRATLKLPVAAEAAKGMYAWRKPTGKSEGTIVLQGSEVGLAFCEHVLPVLDEKKINAYVYYVSSAELFDALPIDEQKSIFPDERAQEAMGITGFTLPTMLKWIVSQKGREATLYPFKSGEYLGSGQAKSVMNEAAIDGKAQLEAVLKFFGH